MKKALAQLAIALALLAPGAGAVAAVCSSTSDLGAIAPGGTELFGNAFTSAGARTDCYTLSLAGFSDAFGGTLTIDPLSFLDIAVTSISLYTGGVLNGETSDVGLHDLTPGVFSFTGLSVGSYTLVAVAVVTRGMGWDDILPLPVGYAGSITTNATNDVPEPGTLALLGFGLLGVAVARRRRQ